MHTPFHHGAWLCSPSGLPPARYPLGRAHLPLEAQVRLQIERAECRQARSRATERCGGRFTLAVRTLRPSRRLPSGAPEGFVTTVVLIMLLGDRLQKSLEKGALAGRAKG